MTATLWHWLLRAIRQIENHTKTPADELEPLREVDTAFEESVTPVERPGRSLSPAATIVLAEPFTGPLPHIPRRRYGVGGVFDLYGRPPKDSDHRQYAKARLSVHRFPGHWNHGKARLYLLDVAAPYLREALRRCEVLGVLDHLTLLGAYNHRHMRHDSRRPLSLHAWGCAVDINVPANRARSWSSAWHTATGQPLPGPSPTAQRGPLPLPFSADWRQLWPDGLPYLVVRSFQSVGWEWGGDWGRRQWVQLVEQYGEGYHASALDTTLPWVRSALAEWQTITFVDPMHFQLKLERPREAGAV